MYPKIVFIGAGSFIFARKIIMDILHFPELSESQLVLMDIDAERLKISEKISHQILSLVANRIEVSATTDLNQALLGADFVLAMFEPHGLQGRKIEVEVPLAYGVPQAVGDTLGPGGIFKGIRTATEMLKIARSMESLCPDALLMNYVNPMAVNCWAVNQLTSIRCVGMCHGLSHTLTRLAYYLDLPDELESRAAGINHMCWLLTLTHQGKDVYPALWQRVEDCCEDDPIRFSLMKAFGYFVTESPYHMAEYVPYFTKRFADLKVHAQEQSDLNRSMCGWTGPIIQPSEGTGSRVETKIPKAWDIQLYEGLHQVTYQQELDRLAKGQTPPLRLSEEYAARILSSIISGRPRKMSLNVPNHGLIENLPGGCTVEVPTYVDGQGLHPEGIGALPNQCAALCRRNVDVQSLTVQALAEKNPELVFHALLLDPLTGASLEPNQIRALFDDLIKTLGNKLPNWLRQIT